MEAEAELEDFEDLRLDPLQLLLVLLATRRIHRPTAGALGHLMNSTGRLQQRILAGRLTHHPRMIQRLLGSISPSGINIEQLGKQIQSTLAGHGNGGWFLAILTVASEQHPKVPAAVAHDQDTFH